MEQEGNDATSSSGCCIFVMDVAHLVINQICHFLTVYVKTTGNRQTQTPLSDDARIRKIVRAVRD